MERQPYIRIAKLDQCLRSRKYTSLQELMAETESSRRTVFRDISALERMGAPISFSREFKGYFYVPGHTFKLPELELTEGDLFAIILTEQVVAAMDKTYLGQKIEPSLEKLRIMFQKKIKIAPDKVFSFGLSPQAIAQKKKIACTYKKPGKDEVIELVIEPYHLHFRGKWYLFGWSESSKDFRTYVIQRIEALQVSKDEFIPRTFDPEQHLGKAWGIIKGKKTEVVLEFTEEQAVFMQEKQWHPSQKITKQKNGLMRMTLTVDGLDEVFWWILSYGSNVKVLKPNNLSAGLKAEIGKMAKLYK